jgi:ribonucleoside-triphosphate reductase
MSPTYSVCKTHGYLPGEQFSCPHCGEKAEVYSRITGYYRPVQNWNEGKAQEYKNRKLYEPENSKEMQIGANKQSNEVMNEEASQILDGLYLFTTKTCPNCRAAKEYLKGSTYAVVDAEENPDLAREFSIMQAPTLVEVKEGTAKKYVNASNIKRFAEEQLILL